MTTQGIGIVDRAYAFAVQRHGDQRYGTRPYQEHLLDVERRVHRATDFAGPVLKERQYEARAAAWLHDVLEDTSTTRAELDETFGNLVGSAVWTMSGDGENRDSRVEYMYNRFTKARNLFPDSPTLLVARLVKACDRLSNVMACWEGRDRRLFMYASEHAEFKRRVFEGNEDPAIALVLRQLDDALGVLS